MKFLLSALVKIISFFKKGNKQKDKIDVPKDNYPLF